MLHDFRPFRDKGKWLQDNVKLTAKMIWDAGLQIFTATKIQITALQVVTACNAVVGYHRGSCCLQLQGELNGSRKWTWIWQGV